MNADAAYPSCPPRERRERPRPAGEPAEGTATAVTADCADCADWRRALRARRGKAGTATAGGQAPTRAGREGGRFPLTGGGGRTSMRARVFRPRADWGRSRRGFGALLRWAVAGGSAPSPTGTPVVARGGARRSRKG